MFSQAFELGRVLANVFVYDDSKKRNRIIVSKLVGSDFSKISGNSIKELRKKLELENKKQKIQGLSLLLLAVPLSACGGSDVAEVVSLPEVSGRAIDGYLVGSRVSLSSDPDTFVETISTSGQQGQFSGLFGTG